MKPTDFLVRPFEEADIAPIAALEAKCFSAPWNETMVREAAAHPCFFYLVALADGHFAGYVGIMCVPPEGELANLAVEPALRRRGVGRALLSALEETLAARGVTSVYLDVRASNRGAQALYESVGYEQVGLRRGFYENPREDGLVYRKNIG